MPDEAKIGIAAFCFGAVVAAIISSMATREAAVWGQQKRAIEAGVGYWKQVDPSSPEMEFVYGVPPTSRDSLSIQGVNHD